MFGRLVSSLLVAPKSKAAGGLRRVVGIVLLMLMSLPSAGSAPVVNAGNLVASESLPCSTTLYGQVWQEDTLTAFDDSYSREAGDMSDPTDATRLSLNVTAPGLLANDTIIQFNGTPGVLPDGARTALYSGPSHAKTFTLASDGSFHYVPADGYFGGDSFQYVWYVSGSYCSTVGTVTIAEANRTRAQDDEVSTYVNTTLSDVVPICSYVDVCGLLNNELNLYWDTRVSGVCNADCTNGAIAGRAFATPHGVVTVDPRGTFTYTPQHDFVGTDTFGYDVVNSGAHQIGAHHLCSSGAGCRDFALVTIDVVEPPAPTTPVGVDDAVAADEDTTTPIDLSALVSNDTGGADHVVYVNDTVSDATQYRTNHGSVAVHYSDYIPGEGFKYVDSISYTPDPNYSGPDYFRYFPGYFAGSGGGAGWVTDDVAGTVAITVAAEPDPPSAASDSVTTAFGQPITVDVAANDSDPDGDLDPTSVTRDPDPCANQAHPVCPGDDPATWTALEHGTWHSNGDGTISYTPAAGFFGVAKYPYQICDTTDRCAQTTVGVSVSSVGDDVYNTSEDTPLNVAAPGVLGNDKSGASATVGTTTAHGTLTLNPDGSFGYVPGANFNGVDTFTYTVGTSDVANVTINVAAVDDPPSIYLNAYCDSSIPDSLCIGTDNRDIVEGGTAELNGSITDAEFNGGTLTIDWGDGTSTTGDYPCSGPDCLFGTTPTYSTLCVGDCGSPLYFHLTHVYADDPAGSSDYFAITATAVEGNLTTGTSTSAARVTNVAPSLSLSPEGCDLCSGSYSHLIVAAGEPASIAGNVTDPGADTGTVTIDWGDGSPTSSVTVDCSSTSDLCATPAAQSPSCAVPNTFGLGCGYFDVSHTYATGGDYSVDVTATDDDGGTDSKSAAATISSPPVDNPPTASITTPADGATYTLGQSLDADYSCADDIHVASCVGPVHVDGSVDTSTIGQHTFTVTATDSSGQTGSATSTYHVVYPFAWQSPLLASPEVNQLAAGTKLRLWFSLGGKYGLHIANGLARSRQVTCDTGTPMSASFVTGRISKLSYSNKKGLYYFVWRTRPFWSGTCREMELRLNDGTKQDLYFHFN